jgi:hypothetical protein
MTTKLFVCLYALFWLIRINGCFRRGRQPLLRGEGWFFDVPVCCDFYSGVGRKLLLHYRLRMLLPFVVDIPLATYFILSGHLSHLGWLIVGLSLLIHINHLYSVDIAERQARRHSSLDFEPVSAIVASSLSPRRLRDYSDLHTEWALALSMGIGLTWAFHYYLSDPDHHHLRLVFGIPVIYLYLELGMLLIKRFIIAWRSPVPQLNPTEHIEFREKTREYYLRVCDWCRFAFAAPILLWPWTLGAYPGSSRHMFSGLFWTTLALTILGTVLVEWKRKQLVDASLRVRPVRFRDLLNQSGLARWPLCCQPSVPMMILRGARGYSLNLANSLTYLSAAYLAGMVALVTILHINY